MITPPVFPDWPTFGFADDVRPGLGRARRGGYATALVTITAIDGGSPRPVGAQMLVSEHEIVGFLSGGCVESDVALHALQTIEDGEPRTLVYGQGSPWHDIRLLCGSRMELLVERLSADDPAVAALLDFYANRRPALWISDGSARICVAAEETEGLVWDGAVSKLYKPTCRLIVMGRDPTAMAMASLGAQSGMETCLIRHLGPENPPPLPGVAYYHGDAAADLQALEPDAWTAVAVANHDTETDHAALVHALRSDAFYVGLLGARRRVPPRLTALEAEGLGRAALARLRAPIGVDINGGKAPWEIAVSVVAEVMAVWHSPDAASADASAALRLQVVAGR